MRAPDSPGPQPGEASGARPLAYEVDVQPVWDQHCLECHGGAEPAGDLSSVVASDEFVWKDRLNGYQRKDLRPVTNLPDHV